jgi:hypothetical protein
VGGRREMNAEFWRGNEGNRPLGRLRRRGEDNIKSDLKENRMAGLGRYLSCCG